MTTKTICSPISRNIMSQRGKEVSAIQKRRDPFDEWFLEFPSWPFQGQRWDVGFGAQADTFMPKIDVSETKDEINVDVELAGVPKENIKVEHKDNNLIISGEHKSEVKDDDPSKKWHRVERRYGSFKRILALPDNVCADKIGATSKDGVLKITVPKSQDSKKEAKTIKIQ